jgi:O-antigen ligase
MRNVRIGHTTQASTWVIWGGILITLAFWPGFNDPFNAPKSWVLSIAGFWLFGWVIFQTRTQINNSAIKKATVITSIYLLALSFSYVHTDNKYLGFFGEYQRRTGFLSYFCLVFFFLAASHLYRLNNTYKLEVAVAATGFISSIYGLAQHFRIDFVHWNNPYNSVLSTLGNPDFAAAAMSIFLIVSFGIAIQKKYSSWFRIFAICNTGLIFMVINYSQARQGILTSCIGLILIIFIWLRQKKKSLAYLLGAISLTGGIFVVAGMLNHGPLMKYFYKVSVSYRGDYWRAGWRMFTHHPLFGVGLDRYGANFRQYRDATQSLRRGPELVSNAAHSVPIQLAATGGIFVLLGYLLFTAFVFWRGILTIKKTVGQEQILAMIFFAAWIAYQAQSLISIDNLGIAIWGYILGGVVVGNSIVTTQLQIEAWKEVRFQRLASGILALIFTIVCLFFLRAESSTYSLNKMSVPGNQADLAAYRSAVEKPLRGFLKEPTFVLGGAVRLANLGDFKVAESKIKDLLKTDPHNFEALNILANIYECQKNWELADTTRKEIALIDPFNQTNLLQQGRDEKNAGKIREAHKIVSMIKSFAPKTPEAKIAEQELGVVK